MYALAPSASARCRSSSAPSVVMITIGMPFSASSLRTRLTSFRPSMIGMLMSVRMMSSLVAAIFLSASTPSSASTTSRPRMRRNANTMSCRIVGESSTTKAVAMALHQIRRCPQLRGAALELRRQPRPLQCRRGVRGQEVEQLVIDVGERGVLRQQVPDDHDADHTVANLQRHDNQGALEVGAHAQPLPVDERLARGDHLADAAVGGGALGDLGPLDPLRRQGAQAALVLV